MLRRLIIVSLSCLLCLYLPVATAQQTAKQSGGALFRVQDGHHTLYLFGTIHVGAADFYPLAPEVMQALERAPAVALELDPTKLASLQAAIEQYGVYPPGQSFRTALSAPLQQQLLKVLAQYHIAPKSIERMRPWMIASLLTVEEAEGSGYQSQLAVDSYLANAILKRNKPVIELEGAARQMALFAALSPAQENLLLEDAIKELHDAESATELKAMAECWRRGDLNGLAELLNDKSDKASFVTRFTKEVLLDQRNPYLAERIADLLTQQDGVFAAIGMLHLTGSNDLPALLEQRGLKVERIE